jgi:hypothetical protein
MTDLKHMDVASRNARLRETLEGFGLFVTPIFREDRTDEIDFMHVSVAPPAYAIENGRKLAASGPVPEPMTSAQIAKSIRPSDPDGDNVIEFPSIG